MKGVETRNKRQEVSQKKKGQHLLAGLLYIFIVHSYLSRSSLERLLINVGYNYICLLFRLALALQTRQIRQASHQS